MELNCTRRRESNNLNPLVLLFVFANCELSTSCPGASSVFCTNTRTYTHPVILHKLTQLNPQCTWLIEGVGSCVTFQHQPYILHKCIHLCVSVWMLRLLCRRFNKSSKVLCSYTRTRKGTKTWIQFSTTTTYISGGAEVLEFTSLHCTTLHYSTPVVTAHTQAPPRGAREQKATNF